MKHYNYNNELMALSDQDIKNLGGVPSGWVEISEEEIKTYHKYDTFTPTQEDIDAYEQVLKERQKAKIMFDFEEKAKALVSQYPQTERETWAVQVAEAEAIMGGATTAPMLSNIIGTDDLSTLQAFAQKVLQNRDNLATAMGQLLREKREALEAQTTEE